QVFLGDIIEIEAHFDYFRPVSITHEAPKEEVSFYRLCIHTMDRMISLFGRPDTVTYDIRNNEMEGAVDNYFDVGLHYGNQLKIKLKTNHVVAKEYPRFI
ncbi:oxidoreductase, partial [Bacillus cereus ATCC 10876]|uniref:Gfo/Idh/MocA family protein n=1 Tax=Bacillus cereus TaxID=1396 RepID=UPI0028430CEE